MPENNLGKDWILANAQVGLTDFILAILEKIEEDHDGFTKTATQMGITLTQFTATFLAEAIRLRAEVATQTRADDLKKRYNR